MQICSSKKRGITLVELVVAMGIFAAVTTMAVGTFVTVSRMQSFTDNIKNTQQKLRVAIEMISRLSRQAQVVLVPDPSEVDMYFNLDASKTPQSASRFQIIDDGTGKYSLFYSECDPASISSVSKTCTNWLPSSDLLSGSMRLDNNNSQFKETGAIPPILTVTLKGITSGPSNSPYYSDSLNIVNDIVLEQIQ